MSTSKIIEFLKLQVRNNNINKNKSKKKNNKILNNINLLLNSSIDEESKNKILELKKEILTKINLKH